jgi:hypothetical protein
MKDLLIRWGLQEAGPSAVRGAILGAAAWLAAKNGMLEPFGIQTINGVTTIVWAKVSIAAIAGLPAIAAALIKLFQYHGTNVVKSMTQTQGGNQ